MDATLRKLLLNNRAEGVVHTHVSMLDPLGKFQFNRQTTEELWKLYCEYVYKETDPPIGLAEKLSEYLPVLVDIDLRVADTDDVKMSDGHLYSKSQLETVVQIYQSVLRYILDKVSDEELLCVVLEKSVYVQTKGDMTFLKNGFHLHFPYIFLNKTDQIVHLIPRVKAELNKSQVFLDLGITESDSVLDTNVCTNPWLMYKSKKTLDGKPYLVTRFLNGHLRDIDIETALSSFELFDNKENLIDKSDHGLEWYLPRILSVSPLGRRTREVKPGLVSPLKEKIRQQQRPSITTAEDRGHSVTDNLLTIRRLMPMLAEYRANDYNMWLKIGFILHSATDGHQDALEHWLEFSRRSPEKFDENVCLEKWESMTGSSRISLGSLHYFAKQDNPEQYNAFRREISDDYMERAIDGGHYDLAKALFADYGTDFVCSAQRKGGVWHKFENHKWVEGEPVALRLALADGYSERYKKMAEHLMDKMNKCENRGERDLYFNKSKHCLNMMRNLKNRSFVNKVLEAAEDYFYRPEFTSLLDTNPALFAFKNGVYDLDAKQFRRGMPEDYISKCAPINYEIFKPDDPRVLAVYTFFEQIFPDKLVREYFINNVSDIFFGGNHEKIVVFWTGEGDNGKSVTQSLFERMLGPYAIKLNTNVVTGKKPSAGAAFADLARSGGGVRWVVLEEPNPDETINIGILKHLTGNDTYYARDLYERGKGSREIKPLFKLACISNKLPHLKYADKAVWNRVKVIPFESTFCKPDNPPPATYEEQLLQKRFPRDSDFERKIPGLLEPLAWILLEHRKKPMNRIEPEKVRMATELYRKQNDYYRQFADENLVPDPKSYIELSELYQMFKEWFKQAMPNGRDLPGRDMVEEYFTRAWGSPPDAQKRWKGYRIRNLAQELAEGTAVNIASPVTPRRTAPVNIAPQPSQPVTVQQAAPVAQQQTSPVAQQQTSPVAQQQTSPVAQQQTSPAISQKTEIEDISESDLDSSQGEFDLASPKIPLIKPKQQTRETEHKDISPSMPKLPPLAIKTVKKSAQSNTQSKNTQSKK
jgi:P4 family phage/plasmid primase-like protien